MEEITASPRVTRRAVPGLPSRFRLDDRFITEVVAAHSMWKYRLHSAIESGRSKFSPETVARDDQCQLGKWLYGDAPATLGHSSEYERIRLLHAEFHQIAAKVLDLALAGKRDDARSQLSSRSPFLQTSTTLVQLIDALRPGGQGEADAETVDDSMRHELVGNVLETAAQAEVASRAAVQVCSSVDAVAAAVEEMATAIGDVAANAGSATEVAAAAVATADEASSRVNRLTQAVAKLDQALSLTNATAECTRETAAATDDVSRAVGEINASVDAVLAGIADFASTAREIQDRQARIVGAVEEENAAANEITRRVTEAATAGTAGAENVAAVSLAARNSRASAEAAERRAHHMQAAADVSQALSEARLNEGAAAHDIAAHIAEALGDVCVIAQLAEDGHSVVAVAAYADDPAVSAAARDAFFPIGFDATSMGLTGRAISTGRVVRAGDDAEAIAAAWHPDLREFIRHLGLRSVAVVPMHSEGEVVGVITLMRYITPRGYDDTEVQLLQDLADRAGLVLTNARLHATVEASQQRFRGAFDDAPVGMALVSLEAGRIGEVFKVNAALCMLTGHPEHRLVGMSLSELVHPDDRDGGTSMMPALVAGRPGAVAERRLVRADGETIWVRATTSVVHLEGQSPYTIAHLADITAAKRAELALTSQALHDPLTGLPNRHLLMDHVGLALDQLDRGSDAVALLYLDLDGFKDVNDTLGHDAGDEVLVQIGARLAASVRAPDTAARVGGDEFVVVCPGIGEDLDATRIADRLEAALAEPVRVAGEELDLGASIGVATTRSSATRADDLLRQADLAMYQAKRKGRGRWEMYDQAIQNQALARLSTLRDLRDAIDKQWLRLHYQPVVDLANGRIVGCEALLRIAHPERGLLYPDAFIEVAENSDLILPIGEWVLQEACAQLARWRGSHPFHMAINVSGRQVVNGPMVDRVLAAAAEAGVDPTRLTLEMTERVLIDAGDPKVDELRRLAEHGVSLAIDDFGTGYSSLTYLKRFPVDTVKIDRSFVAGLGVNAQDTAIVEAITALTGTLGLTAVAEGVETHAQLATLRGLGCQRAQGFHFARPMSADDMTGMLATAAASPPRHDQHAQPLQRCASVSGGSTWRAFLGA